MGAARQQQARIGGRQRVDILGRVQRIQHGGFVQMPRQRQLHQDAVHAGIGGQFLDLRHQFGLRHIGGQFDMHRLEAQRLGGLALVANIDFRSRVLADQYGGQAGL
jgi:hypothetical protein